MLQLQDGLGMTSEVLKIQLQQCASVNKNFNVPFVGGKKLQLSLENYIEVVCCFKGEFWYGVISNSFFLGE